jgi:transposase
MRGRETKQSSMLMLMSPESVVPEKHPLRGVKRLADAALARMSLTFDAIYADGGRPSIPPERLLKAQLLIALYTVRSERQLCEQLAYNLLFRWCLDMDMTEEVFDHSTFSINRDRLIAHDAAGEFFREVLSLGRDERLMSDDHFTVDGTLIEAWASLKSFKRKCDDKKDPPDEPGNPSVDFHGEKRSNATHESTTDPEAKLARKGNGKEAKLSFSMHSLMENRNGLLVDLVVDEANGTTERTTALEMLDELRGDKLITVGADKAYDTRDFVAKCRKLNVTPLVAQNQGPRRRSAIDDRTTRPPGYAISQRIRKRVEEIFGWIKTTGGLRKTRSLDPSSGSRGWPERRRRYSFPCCRSIDRRSRGRWQPIS